MKSRGSSLSSISSFRMRTLTRRQRLPRLIVQERVREGERADETTKDTMDTKVQTPVELMTRDSVPVLDRGSAPDPGSVARGDPCAPLRSLAGAPCAPKPVMRLETSTKFSFQTA